MVDLMLNNIAHAASLGYFRNLGRNPEVIDSEISERLADNMEDQSEAISREDDERREKLEQLLTQLPEKAQELVRLRFFENREYDEIARLLNTNEGAVRTALRRIIAKLRSMAKESMQEAM